MRYPLFLQAMKELSENGTDEREQLTGEQTDKHTDRHMHAYGHTYKQGVYRQTQDTTTPLL